MVHKKVIKTEESENHIIITEYDINGGNVKKAIKFLNQLSKTKKTIIVSLDTSIAPLICNASKPLN